MQMLYVVVDRAGEPIAEGLTEAEAAHEILTYDSAQYELRPEEDGVGYRLWGREMNGRWSSYRFYSLASSLADAQAELMSDVVRTACTGERWKAEAVPQAEWDEMQARLAEENDQ
jgi:hypothetical protein